MKTEHPFKMNDRVVCSCHGAGKVIDVRKDYVGVHWDWNKKDDMVDCWYSDENNNGVYSAGHGVAVLSHEKSITKKSIKQMV